MNCHLSGRLAFVGAFVGLFLCSLACVSPALAQSTDSVRVASPAASTGTRPVTTVPLPNGRGIFYYRAGTPGGVRIRSRNGTRRDTLSAVVTQEIRTVAAPATATPALANAASVPVPTAAAADGLTRLDLLELERNLIAAFERRIAALERDVNRSPAPLPAAFQQTPIIVLPGQQTPTAAAAPPLAAPRTPLVTVPNVAVAPPTIVTPTTPVRPPVTVTPPVQGGVTIEEIERAILDTGLFRTTTINFEFAKATLLPVSQRTLDALGAALRRHPSLRIEVGGHTDNVGSDATNDRLSQRRSESVLEYLVAKDVDRSRLTAVGYGERLPIAANTNDTGRALNRRVEFTLLNPEAAVEIRRTTREGVLRDDAREAAPNSPEELRRILREELERLRQLDSEDPPADV